MHNKNFYAQKGVTKGAKFVPTVANIFMSKWGHEDTFKNQEANQLRMFKRYIVDVFILWEGTEETLKQFLERINVNKYEITFSGNPYEINFSKVFSKQFKQIEKAMKKH